MIDASTSMYEDETDFVNQTEVETQTYLSKINKMKSSKMEQNVSCHSIEDTMKIMESPVSVVI